MATNAPTTRTPKAADRRISHLLAVAAASVVGLPPALAAYAHSRPLSEAECVASVDYVANGRWAEVTSCRIAGVTVSTTVAPLLTIGGR